jgi:Mg-chelatase subunit ChlI-like protein
VELWRSTFAATYFSIVHLLFLHGFFVKLASEWKAGRAMVVRVATVAFEGIEARPVDVQVQIANGNVVFTVGDLGDKAVAESRERVRAALNASGVAMPAKRITVNLAPADLPKEGSHYDLPIALGIIAAIGAIPPDSLSNYTVLGELALDETITAVAGVLPAAIAAMRVGTGSSACTRADQRQPGRRKTSMCWHRFR